MTTLETGLHYPLQLDKLPEGWEAGYVGDFAIDIEPGFASGEHNREGTGVPHLRPMNIDRSGKIDLNVVKYVDPAKNVRRLRCGDVLFNNTNSPELIGKTTAITKQMDWAFSNHMTRIGFSERVDPKFAAYQLHFLWMTGYFLHKCVKHVNQASVSSTTLARTVPFVRAPLEQQKAIVAEIEKQFSRLDEAIVNLKRVKANLKRYKAAVLKAAVEGKLTEEWRRAHPDVEPASELLKGILAERRTKWEEAELAKMKAAGKNPNDDRWKNRYKEPDPTKAEDTYDIPEFWVWASLGQLCWSVKYGPHYSPKYVTAGIPFVTGGNVRPEGIDFSSAKYISPKLHAELSERCKPEYGDLLYTKGGTTGIARINTETREFNVWVHVAVLKLVDSIERFYLQHALNSPHCYRQSQGYTHGVGNQDLGLTRMIWITVPLPPLNEQRQIIHEIESRMSVVRKIEREIDANLSRTDRLRHSFFACAFSGQLKLRSMGILEMQPNSQPHF